MFVCSSLTFSLCGLCGDRMNLSVFMLVRLISAYLFYVLLTFYIESCCCLSAFSFGVCMFDVAGQVS